MAGLLLLQSSSPQLLNKPQVATIAKSIIIFFIIFLLIVISLIFSIAPIRILFDVTAGGTDFVSRNRVEIISCRVEVT